MLQYEENKENFGCPIATVLSSISVSAKAVAPLEVAGITEDNNMVSSTITASPSIVSEEVLPREQNVKHFQLSDGSYTAVIYDESIHYKQENEWVEIDNSLVSASLVGEPLTGTIKRDSEMTANEKQDILQYK